MANDDDIWKNSSMGMDDEMFDLNEGMDAKGKKGTQTAQFIKTIGSSATSFTKSIIDVNNMEFGNVVDFVSVVGNTLKEEIAETAKATFGFVKKMKIDLNKVKAEGSAIVDNFKSGDLFQTGARYGQEDDFDFGMMDEDDDEDYGDSPSDGTTEANVAGHQMSATATIKGAELVASASSFNTKKLMQSISKSDTAKLKLLGDIAVSSKITSKAVTEGFNKQLLLQREMLLRMETLVKFQTIPDKSKEDAFPDSVKVFGSQGDVTEYEKVLRRNFKSLREDNMVASMLSMSGSMGGKSKTKATLPNAIMKMVADMSLTSGAKHSFFKAERSMNAIPAMFGDMIDRLNFQGGILSSMVGELLSPMRAQVDDSSLRSTREQRHQISSMDHVAWTQVIPQYLSMILEASGGKSVEFDYSRGIFRTKKSGMQADQLERMNVLTQNNMHYGDTISAINSERSKMSSDSRYKGLINAMDPDEIKVFQKDVRTLGLELARIQTVFISDGESLKNAVEQYELRANLVRPEKTINLLATLLDDKSSRAGKEFKTWIKQAKLEHTKLMQKRIKEGSVSNDRFARQALNEKQLIMKSFASVSKSRFMGLHEKLVSEGKLDPAEQLLYARHRQQYAMTSRSLAISDRGLSSMSDESEDPTLGRADAGHSGIGVLDHDALDSEGKAKNIAVLDYRTAKGSKVSQAWNTDDILVRMYITLLKGIPTFADTSNDRTHLMMGLKEVGAYRSMKLAKQKVEEDKHGEAEMNKDTLGEFAGSMHKMQEEYAANRIFFFDSQRKGQEKLSNSKFGQWVSKGITNLNMAFDDITSMNFKNVFKKDDEEELDETGEFDAEANKRKLGDVLEDLKSRYSAVAFTTLRAIRNVMNYNNKTSTILFSEYGGDLPAFLYNEYLPKSADANIKNMLKAMEANAGPPNAKYTSFNLDNDDKIVFGAFETNTKLFTDLFSKDMPDFVNIFSEKTLKSHEGKMPYVPTSKFAEASEVVKALINKEQKAFKTEEESDKKAEKQLVDLAVKDEIAKKAKEQETIDMVRADVEAQFEEYNKQQKLKASAGKKSEKTVDDANKKREPVGVVLLGAYGNYSDATKKMLLNKYGPDYLENLVVDAKIKSFEANSISVMINEFSKLMPMMNKMRKKIDSGVSSAKDYTKKFSGKFGRKRKINPDDQYLFDNFENLNEEMQKELQEKYPKKTFFAMIGDGAKAVGNKAKNTINDLVDGNKHLSAGKRGLNRLKNAAKDSVEISADDELLLSEFEKLDKVTQDTLEEKYGRTVLKKRLGKIYDNVKKNVKGIFQPIDAEARKSIDNMSNLPQEQQKTLYEKYGHKAISKYLDKHNISINGNNYTFKEAFDMAIHFKFLGKPEQDGVLRKFGKDKLEEIQRMFGPKEEEDGSIKPGAVDTAKARWGELKDMARDAKRRITDSKLYKAFASTKFGKAAIRGIKGTIKDTKDIAKGALKFTRLNLKSIWYAKKYVMASSIYDPYNVIGHLNSYDKAIKEAKDTQGLEDGGNYAVMSNVTKRILETHVGTISDDEVAEWVFENSKQGMKFYEALILGKDRVNILSFLNRHAGLKPAKKRGSIVDIKHPVHEAFHVYMSKRIVQVTKGMGENPVDQIFTPVAGSEPGAEEYPDFDKFIEAVRADNWIEGLKKNLVEHVDYLKTKQEANAALGDSMKALRKIGHRAGRLGGKGVNKIGKAAAYLGSLKWAKKVGTGSHKGTTKLLAGLKAINPFRAAKGMGVDKDVASLASGVGNVAKAAAAPFAGAGREIGRGASEAAHDFSENRRSKKEAANQPFLADKEKVALARGKRIPKKRMRLILEKGNMEAQQEVESLLPSSRLLQLFYLSPGNDLFRATLEWSLEECEAAGIDKKTFVMEALKEPDELKRLRNVQKFMEFFSKARGVPDGGWIIGTLLDDEDKEDAMGQQELYNDTRKLAKKKKKAEIRKANKERYGIAKWIHDTYTAKHNRHEDGTAMTDEEIATRKEEAAAKKAQDKADKKAALAAARKEKGGLFGFGKNKDEKSDKEIIEDRRKEKKEDQKHTEEMDVQQEQSESLKQVVELLGGEAKKDKEKEKDGSGGGMGMGIGRAMWNGAKALGTAAVGLTKNVVKGAGKLLKGAAKGAWKGAKAVGGVIAKFAKFLGKGLAKIGMKPGAVSKILGPLKKGLVKKMAAFSARFLSSAASGGVLYISAAVLAAGKAAILAGRYFNLPPSVKPTPYMRLVASAIGLVDACTFGFLPFGPGQYFANILVKLLSGENLEQKAGAAASYAKERAKWLGVKYQDLTNYERQSWTTQLFASATKNAKKLGFETRVGDYKTWKDEIWEKSNEEIERLRRDSGVTSVMTADKKFYDGCVAIIKKIASKHKTILPVNPYGEDPKDGEAAEERARQDALAKGEDVEITDEEAKEQPIEVGAKNIDKDETGAPSSGNASTPIDKKQKDIDKAKDVADKSSDEAITIKSGSTTITSTGVSAEDTKKMLETFVNSSGSQLEQMQAMNARMEAMIMEAQKGNTIAAANATVDPMIDYQ